MTHTPETRPRILSADYTPSGRRRPAGPLPDHEVARNQITAAREPWTPRQVAEMLSAHFAVENIEELSHNNDVCWGDITLDDGQRFTVRVERMRPQIFDDRA